MRVWGCLGPAHTKARFHRRFSGGLDQLKHTPFRTNTLSAGAPVDPFAQLGALDQARMKRHVSNNYRLNHAQVSY
jgi:hypothetical protein